ncbi:hypothetical protein Hypma_001935 [Hypsizygus marmoreus]|uniref:Uncharacterized protein n=1 Tax=Hypsizygus marmoreus TaxID=39966 RepID=A0A369J5G5_HYPMA|nr:hypothetical protein Hypma_001935 [Hypsizygus marmoreus]
MPKDPSLSTESSVYHKTREPDVLAPGLQRGALGSYTSPLHLEVGSSYRTCQAAAVAQGSPRFPGTANNSSSRDKLDGLFHDSPYMTPPYHVNLLPPEILAEIFVHCISEKEWVYPYQKSTPPMSLTHVCTHWRAIATSLSILWSSLALRRVGHRFDARNWLPTWLERSQNRPLNFHIVEFEPVALLLPHLHRWNGLSVVVDDRNVQHFLTIPLARASSLSSLTICADKCNQQALDELLASAHVIPNLRHFSWHSEYMPSTLVDLPFWTLTHLNLDCPIRLEQLLHFLSNSKQVIDLAVEDIRPPLTSAVVNVTLPHLISLDVRCNKFMSQVLDCLTLPTLRRLKLAEFTTKGVTYRKHEILSRLIARSSCRLETFDLNDYRITEEDLIGYLTDPCLRSVQTLNAIFVTDRALALLIYPTLNALGESILPCLTSLCLQGCYAADGTFAEMLASRWSPARKPNDGILPASLTFVNVAFRVDMSAMKSGVPLHGLDFEAAKTCMEKGLNIRWSEGFS